MVDEYSRVKVFAFFPRKNNVIETMYERVQKTKNSGTTVTYLRQDNVREELKIQSRCESAYWKLTVKFEYTAKETPQKNLMSETAFTTLAARGRVILTAANVTIAERFSLSQE